MIFDYIQKWLSTDKGDDDDDFLLAHPDRQQGQWDAVVHHLPGAREDDVIRLRDPIAATLLDDQYLQDVPDPEKEVEAQPKS